MNRQKIGLILCLCGLAGCDLAAPPEITVRCPDAAYYLNADGNKDGTFDDPEDKYYQIYSDTQFCPKDYPICRVNDDVTFCHQLCRENEVFCGDHCIKPNEDKTYCGAKGLCNDQSQQSEHYLGQTCQKDQECKDGQCVCALSTDVMCGDVCVDPNNNDEYCGAKGLCNDPDEGSDNYMGITCDKSQRCSEGHCICAREYDIDCGGKCIDPDTDMTYCGAKGL